MKLLERKEIINRIEEIDAAIDCLVGDTSNEFQYSIKLLRHRMSLLVELLRGKK